MNIFLVFPDNDTSIEKLETLFNKVDNKVFKISIEGFAKLSSDYFSEFPSITSNEVLNIIVEQISNQQQLISVNPDLILLHSGLNFSALSNYIKRWKNCDVYLISESESKS